MSLPNSINITIYPLRERLVSLLHAIGVFAVAAVGVFVCDFWFGQVLCVAIALLSGKAIREDCACLVDAFCQMREAPDKQGG